MTIGVLLLNTGTPASCKPKDVKKYLTKFLMDERVLDYPFWLREILVKWLIVPFRHKKSARAYAKIWTPQGSPLLVHSKELVCRLSEELNMKVAIGLSYCEPSIEQALESLKGCVNLIVVPLFPQYASATSGSVIQEVMRCLSAWQTIPELTILGPFANFEPFLSAWCEHAREFDLAAYDHILFSFHGLPVRQVRKACCPKRNCCQTLNEDNAYCYPAQCVYLAQELARRLEITNYTLCYQSRLGTDKWLSPYTLDVLKARRKLGDKKLLVFAPSFVTDCLETLYEIGIEYRAEFLMHGGDTLDLVPSLNCHPSWLMALASHINSSR